MKTSFLPALVYACFLGVIPLFAQPTEAQLNRIATLVEEEKFREARLITDLLLVDYPDDPQLKKIKVLLDSAPAAPAKPQPATPTPPPANPLTGEERLALNTTVQGVQQAARQTNAIARRAALKKVLALPIPKTSSSGAAWIPYWQARAVAALELDDLVAGWQSAQILKQLGALELTDAGISRVMSELNLKGWLTLNKEDVLRKIAEQEARDTRKAAWIGTWRTGGLTLEIEGNDTPRFLKFTENRSSGNMGSTSIIPGSYSFNMYGYQGNILGQGSGTNQLLDATFSDDFLQLAVKYHANHATTYQNGARDTVNDTRTLVFHLRTEQGRFVVQDGNKATYLNARIEAAAKAARETEARRLASIEAERRRTEAEKQAEHDARAALLNAGFQKFVEARQLHTIADLGLELIPLGTPLRLASDATRESIARHDYGKDWQVHGFWLGKTEVTQAQYRAVMGTNPGKPSGDNLPVNGITWEQAIAFCQKLTEREHAAGRLDKTWRYTLPSAKQWELAAGEPQSASLSQVAWFAGEPKYDKNFWGNFVFEGYQNGTSGLKLQPVAQKAANAKGFHDLFGNVQEWCMDQRDNSTDTPGTWRVTRGGTYMSTSEACLKSDYQRATATTIKYRVGEDDYAERQTIGFRVALVHRDNVSSTSSLGGF